MSKSYDELEFTDNFMFVKIMSTEPELCKEMLELILNRKISRLKLVEYESTRQEMYESKGIRLDVYTEDEDQTVYDVEMQAAPDSDVAKRSRYYHSVIDMEQLKKGSHYSDLKKSIVIFICKERIADGFDLPVYTFRYRSDEDNGKTLDDGACTVFVNACCRKENVSPQMAEFLEFIRTGKVNGNKDSLTNRLHDAVALAKRTGKWSAEFMRWEDELNDRYHKGFMQGIEHQKQYTVIEKDRADNAEDRADKAEDRADKAEDRADKAEDRADKAEAELALYKEKFGVL